MSTKNKKLAVRILAWVLAIMMVIGIAVLTVQMIIENVQAEKEQQEQTEDKEDGHDHDH